MVRAALLLSLSVSPGGSLALGGCQDRRGAAPEAAAASVEPAVAHRPADRPAPPPERVAVTVRRLGRGSGSALVSNGIPLRPGRLFARELESVRLVLDGAEEPIAVRALSGTHRDGSLRAILVQFRRDIPGRRPLRGTLELGVRRRTADPAPVPIQDGVPEAAVLPTDPEYLIGTDIVGPTIPVSASRKRGRAFRSYEQKFIEFSNSHWRKEDDDWSGNYYDRALIYFAFWARSGNTEYWERGARQAVAYRNGYLVANKYGASPHWSQIEGVALHYWLTGDERSRTAVIKTAKYLTGAFTVEKMGSPTYPYTEGRIQARLLLAALNSWMLGDRSRDWGEMADGYADNAIELQQPDGSYRWQICSRNECPRSEVWGTSNFMLGLQNDALIKYYRIRRADPRIPTTVRKAADWLWRTQWSPGAQAFQYWNVSRTQTKTQDVTQLITLTFGFAYHQTGIKEYRERGDQMFAAAVAKAFYQGSKQFNQQYYDSFNYLWYRENPLSTAAAK